MPAVRMFGRKWRVSSDFLPVFAGIGLVFHFCWIIFIIVWPFGVTKVRKCDNTTAGRHFLASVALFFILYILSFIQELLITLIGLRGTPLETSKRRFMNPVLYTQLFNWVGQLGVVSYGTYVVRHQSTNVIHSDCDNASVTMLTVLVWSSWAMLAFNWGRLLVVYSLFPDYERVDSWAKRIRFYTWYSRSKNVITHLEKHQRRPLGRLAELYSRLLHGADLSPSDEFISLILLSAAQRKSRQAHVRNAIKLHRQQTASARQHPDMASSGHEDGRAPPPPPSHGPSRSPSQSSPGEGLLQSHGQMVQTARSLNQMGRPHPQSQGSIMEAEQTGLQEGSAERLNSDDQHRSESEAESGTHGRPATQLNGEMQNQRSRHSLEESDSDIGEEMQDTLNRIHTPNAAGDSQGPTQSQAQSPDAQRDRDSHVIDMPAEGREALPPQCSASSVHGDAPAGGKVKRRSQPASSKKADVQDLKDMEEGGSRTDTQTEQKKSGSDSPEELQSRRSSRQKLNQDEFFKRDFMLAPSSFACELEPDVAPDKLADIYTGYKERVSRPEVTEAARFAKYAIAAYGAAGYQYLHQTSKVATTYNLLRNRGKEKYRANKLMASKITTLEQHLDYEAIIQIAEIDDQDLLYLNFENQALGDLPYMLALDRPTKSIVVAIRGTVSVADLATDMLADPEPMEAWLPDTMTEAEESVIEHGPRRAHAGIMAAATAIWKDLRAHRILPALLNRPDNDSDDETNPAYDIGAGKQDGFEQAYGPDENPDPNPEEQRLPAPHEAPGVHSKKEPVAPVSLSGHGSPQRSPGRSPGTRALAKQKSNPMMLVGQGMKAGINTLHGVPQQAVGHMMGGGHHHKKESQQEATAAHSPHQGASDSSPTRGAGHNSPHKGRGARCQRPQDRRQHAARLKEQHEAEAHRGDSGHDSHALQQNGHASTSATQGTVAEDSEADNGQDPGQNNAGWDKVRKVVRGSAMPVKPIKDSVTAALESKSPPPEGNPESRQLKHSESSSGSMSQNTTGPLQFIYSRGGKMAAVLAMLGHKWRQEKTAEKDVEAKPAPDVARPDSSDPCEITSSGAEDHPGDDPVSQFGASKPQQAAGRQSATGSDVEENKDSSTRNLYAAHIVRQGLNKEGWKLVVTGHSLGAGAAALIALKLKDRFPEVKCWAFCPPGGLLTPNMAHSMKPFCTSVVVNKDCIPRMSLKNLNRFMEGKLMALACSRLNAFQIFWGSYGKVNRRGFFDRDIFRPFSTIPDEAREMLDRFQECTLTDVSAQDMVPPGRVMYLRRFKASPNACPIKQEEHRRGARARKVVTKPTTSTVSSIRRMTSSDSDSSGTRTSLGKMKERLPFRPTHAVAAVKHDRTELNGSVGADHQDQICQHSDHDREHQELCHDHRASSYRANNSGQEQDQSQGHQEQAEQDEGEEAYRRAGLQKPRQLSEGDGDSDTGCTMLQRIRRRRARKAALHASLKNPKDLFWDAVWIQPEDIIREGLLVSPKMTEDHYTTSLLQSLKAVSERLAEQEGKSGKEQTQGSSQVAAADKKSNDPGQESQNNESGGLKEAVLGGVFDLV